MKNQGRNVLGIEWGVGREGKGSNSRYSDEAIESLSGLTKDISNRA